MAQERPPKDRVRRLWVEVFREIADRVQGEHEEPTYLTLSGARGLDIELLIEEGLVETMEGGQIASADSDKVVAVEKNSEAYASIKRRFPGLKVLEQPIQNILAGDGLTSWPRGDHAKYARAEVVNLDLNSPLTSRNRNGGLYFPVIAWVQKFARLHAEPEPLDWILCLTLNAELPWGDADSERAIRFLKDNMERDQDFRRACREHGPDEVVEAVEEDGTIQVADLSAEDRQKLLMVFVPKRVARAANREGWRLATRYNLRYGGVESAPMVTWIFEFVWDEGVETEPDANYREALRSIFSNVGSVDEDGNLRIRALLDDAA